MLIYAYSVFDKKAQTYNTPFFCKNDAVALRAFEDLVTDTRTTVGTHPEDYSLYLCGIFDDERGGFGEGAPAYVIAEASEVIRRKIEQVQEISEENK